MIEPEVHQDQRGFFARSFCRQEFEARGLDPAVAQCNISFNRFKGCLRGMHFQTAPHSEAKLVRCTAGSVYDVIIDLRAASPTFKDYFAVELSAQNRKMVYVPQGFAHGFQTLEDNTEVFYQMSQYYCAENSRGVRWDDPAFGIKWPAGERIIIDRDRKYPDFVSQEQSERD